MWKCKIQQNYCSKKNYKRHGIKKHRKQLREKRR